MTKKTLAPAALAAFLVSGCAHRLPSVNAISADRIGAVEIEVKRQLSVYQSHVNAVRQGRTPDSESTKHCGNGSIDFDIETVKLDIATTFDTTKSGSAGVTVPIPIGTIGGTIAGSKEVADTEELTFSLYPIPQPAYSLPGPEKTAVLSDALLALRTALIKGASADSVCVYDYDAADPEHDPGGTYEFGTTITDDGSGGVELKLAILDLSGKYERKSITGNTITVTFHQSGIKEKHVDPNTGKAIFQAHPRAITY